MIATDSKLKKACGGFLNQFGFNHCQQERK